MFGLKFLLPINHLLVWQQEISAAQDISSNTFYKKTDYGNIGLEAIKHLITLHSVKTTKESITQERDWFNEGYLTPKSVKSIPLTTEVNSFRSILMNHPARKIITEYDMTPNELSMICQKRYLSGDHMMWMTKQPIIDMCYNVEDHKKSGLCKERCSNYPLQSCSNVCGVVAVVMSALFSLSPELFQHLTKQNTLIPFNFLQQPTKYNKYLRRVLMCWLASSFINIEYISPVTKDAFVDLPSVSEEDVEMLRTSATDRVNPFESGEAVHTKSQNIDGNKITNPYFDTESGRFKCPICIKTFTKNANVMISNENTQTMIPL